MVDRSTERFAGARLVRLRIARGSWRSKLEERLQLIRNSTMAATAIVMLVVSSLGRHDLSTGRPNIGVNGHLGIAVIMQTLLAAPLSCEVI